MLTSQGEEELRTLVYGGFCPNLKFPGIVKEVLHYNPDEMWIGICNKIVVIFFHLGNACPEF
jgi:hypothetical protein